MNTLESTPPGANSSRPVGPRIFFLELSGGRISSARPDGSDLRTVIAGGEAHPDGIAVDPVHGHLFWTNMGNPSANDGSIYRANLDDTERTVILSG